MNSRGYKGTRRSWFTNVYLLIALLLIFNYGNSQACPNVGEYGGLTPVDPKRSTISVNSHVEKLFSTDNPVNISSYFRITDIPAKAKTIELINAVVMQYGKTGDATVDKNWQKIFNDDDKLEPKIGYSRPVRFRVWYDVEKKDIKAAAYLYNPLTLKTAQYRNNDFKAEKDAKIIELPRQVLFGNWVFGGKKKSGCNGTEKCSGPKCNGYRGKQNVTKLGYTCQAWNKTSPHKHSFNNSKMKKSGGLVDNYCRNPSSSTTIWCYTNDPKKRWDYCDPKWCEESNMTNKWFFVGIKMHTALVQLKYSNGYQQPPSLWTAFTQPDTDLMGHSLDSLYVRRKVNVFQAGQKNYGPRGALCECSDGQRYYIGEEAKFRATKDMKTVKFGCYKGKLLKKFGNKKDCKQCNHRRVYCDHKDAWWTKRMSDYGSETSSENSDKYWMTKGRSLKYYYTIAGDSLKSWNFWHMDKTKDDKGKDFRYKGSFLGHTWGANGSEHMIERFNHSNMLIHFRPNSITPNDKNGDVLQSNWFTNAKVKIQRINQNPIYDTADTPDLHTKARVNGYFISSNNLPSDVTAASRTIYAEILYKIPSFFSKTENFRYSEFNKMLSTKYNPGKKQVWLNNSNWSNHLDLRRWLRVYRLQLDKDTPLVDVGFHFDMDYYYNKILRRNLFEER